MRAAVVDARGAEGTVHLCDCGLHASNMYLLQTLCIAEWSERDLRGRKLRSVQVKKLWKTGLLMSSFPYSNQKRLYRFLHLSLKDTIQATL